MATDSQEQPPADEPDIFNLQTWYNPDFAKAMTLPILLGTTMIVAGYFNWFDWPESGQTSLEISGALLYAAGIVIAAFRNDSA